MDNTPALLQRAQRLNTQATAQLERSQQLQQVLFELQPLPRPAPALPYWAISFAIGVAFALGIALGGCLL